MARDLPGSVTNSLRVLTALVATSGVVSVLTWFMRDDLIMAWSKGNPSAQEILAQGGLDALRENQIVPGFVAVAVVSFVIFALHALVVAAFLVGGYGWARMVLTATAGVGVFVAAVALHNDLPTAFVVLSGVMVVLGLVLVALLWRRETSEYLRVT